MSDQVDAAAAETVVVVGRAMVVGVVPVVLVLVDADIRLQLKASSSVHYTQSCVIPRTTDATRIDHVRCKATCGSTATGRIRIRGYMRGR